MSARSWSQVLMVTLLLKSTACSGWLCPKPPPCPTCPPRPPATVVVQPDPPPCVLAALISPTGLGALPQGNGMFLVQRPALEALGLYLADVQRWMDEATTCLRLGARLPAAVTP